MVKIIFTKYGVADRIGDEILINEKLPNSPELYNWILSHELSHSGSFSKDDFKKDFRKEDFKMSWKVLQWQLKNPSGLTQLLPVRRYKKDFYWDIANLTSWVVGIALFYIVFKITLFFI